MHNSRSPVVGIVIWTKVRYPSLVLHLLPASHDEFIAFSQYSFSWNGRTEFVGTVGFRGLGSRGLKTTHQAFPKV